MTHNKEGWCALVSETDITASTEPSCVRACAHVCVQLLTAVCFLRYSSVSWLTRFSSWSFCWKWAISDSNWPSASCLCLLSHSTSICVRCVCMQEVCTLDGECTTMRTSNPCLCCLERLCHPPLPPFLSAWTWALSQPLSPAAHPSGRLSFHSTPTQYTLDTYRLHVLYIVW